MEYIERSSRAFKKTLLALFLGSFVTFADLYSTQPVIPVLAKQFDVSAAAASLTLSFATGALAVCLFLSSFISERLDRKQMMGTALTVSAMLSIAAGFSSSLPLLIGIRTIQGAVLAGFPAIAMAYITEEFHPKSLGYAMGIYVSGSSIGGMAGRLIVGIVSDYFSWNAAIVFLGAVSLVVSLLFWHFLPVAKHHKREAVSGAETRHALMRSLINKRLLLLFFSAFLLMGSFVTIYNYIGIPLMEEPYHLSQTLIGFIFVIYLVGTFSSAWMGRLADRIDRYKVIFICIILMMVGVLLTLNGFLAVKIAGLAVFTFGFFGGHSIASSTVGWFADKKEKAQASSLYLLFYYAGSSLVGASGGLLLGRFSWPGVAGIVLVLLVLALFCTAAGSILTKRLTHRK